MKLGVIAAVLMLSQSSGCYVGTPESNPLKTQIDDTYRRGFRHGFEAGIDSLMLLSLENQMTATNMTGAQMKEVLMNRHAKIWEAE